MMEPYDIWQLERYGNILGKEANLYADEDHDEWKENVEQGYVPIYEKS